MIGEAISLIANICTIVAFIIAVHLWLTWKKQQNYSFTRDKIFEAELAVSTLHTAHMNYVSKHHAYKLKDLQTTEVIDPPFYQQLFREAEQLVQSSSVEYDLAIHSIRVLGVNYSEEEILSYVLLENYYMNFVNQINECESVQELSKLYFEKIAPEMIETRNGASKHLKIIRVNL